MSPLGATSATPDDVQSLSSGHLSSEQPHDHDEPPSTQGSVLPFSANDMAQFSQFQAFLRYQASQVPLQPTLPAPAPAPPALSLPPFIRSTGADAIVRKSIHSLFPHINAKVLVEIANHTFEPCDLCKLDPTLRVKDKNQSLDMEDGRLIIRESIDTKDYPSYSSLMTPLSVYFDILQAFAMSGGSVGDCYLIGRGFATYMRHLMSYSSHYEWSAVLQYHLHFHFRRRQDMIDGDYSTWHTVDEELFKDFLFGRVKTRVDKQRASPASSSSQSRTSAPSSRSRSQQVCFAFNDGHCTDSPCPNGCLHKCRLCGSTDHGDSSGKCRKTA